MKRGKKIYTGKANELYEVIDDNDRVDDSVLEMEFTNRISVDHGEKTGIISKKGYVNCLMSTLLFRRFEEAGIPTHYISRGSTASSQLVRKANMIPIEVIGRNYSAGDFCRRYGIVEGRPFKPMLIEFTYKNDEFHDPMINKDTAVALGIVGKNTIETIKNFTRVINEEATLFFKEEFDLTLIDFKVEFGFLVGGGRLVLADEFNQDTCRLQDRDGRSVDKEVFRKGFSHAEVIGTYLNIVDRLEAML